MDTVTTSPNFQSNAGLLKKIAAYGRYLLSKAGNPILPFLCLIWLSLIAGAYMLLLNYAQVPGPVSRAPVIWPTASHLQRSPGQFTLITFAHPKCPCTTATINELAVLMARCRRLRAYVLFLEPKGFPLNWIKDSTWHLASGIPGVAVLPDATGFEAQMFSATTSGETLVYDPQGRLVFSGGITAARGHEGDNQGMDEIQSIANTNMAQPTTDTGAGINAGMYAATLLLPKTPVFGCPLKDNQDPNGQIFAEVFNKCFK